METVTIEKRKLDWLLEQADLEMEDVDERFDAIDDIMSRLKVGDKVYIAALEDSIGGSYFTKKVTKIIDVENGIIQTSERTYNDTIVEEECILNYHYDLNIEDDDDDEDDDDEDDDE